VVLRSKEQTRLLPILITFLCVHSCGWCRSGQRPAGSCGPSDYGHTVIGGMLCRPALPFSPHSGACSLVERLVEPPRWARTSLCAPSPSEADLREKTSRSFWLCSLTRLRCRAKL